MMTDAARGVNLWNWSLPVAGRLSVTDFHEPFLPDGGWIVYKQQPVPMRPEYMTLVQVAAKIHSPPSTSVMLQLRKFFCADAEPPEFPQT